MDALTVAMNGDPSRTRTCDPVVKSHLLYRLSYRTTLVATCNRIDDFTYCRVIWQVPFLYPHANRENWDRQVPRQSRVYGTDLMPERASCEILAR